MKNVYYVKIFLQFSFFMTWSSLVNISSCLNLLSHNTVARLIVNNMNINMPSSNRYHISLYTKLMMINEKPQVKMIKAVIQQILVNGLLCFSASWIHSLSLPLLKMFYCYYYYLNYTKTEHEIKISLNTVVCVVL